MMIRLCAACRNTSVSRTTGTAPEAMMSASTWPGPTEGSWSMSPTISSAASSGDRLHQRLHQHDVDHGGLVDDQQVAVERIVRVALEAAALGVDLQQAMDGLGLDARRLGHALGGAAGRRAKQQLHALGREDAQDRIDDRRLADARAAGDHQHLGRQRQPDRRLLAVGKLQAGLASRPRATPSRRRSTARAACRSAMREQPLGDRLLGPVEAGQEDAGRLADACRRSPRPRPVRDRAPSGSSLLGTSSSSSASGTRSSVGSPQ